MSYDQKRVVEAIRAFDRQLHAAAQPLTPQDTAPVLKALYATFERLRG